MFWNGWEPLVARLSGAVDSRASKEILRGIRFIWLRRHDTPHQAIPTGQWFKGNGIVALAITYEDLDRHPAGTVNDVLEHLGVRADVTLTQPAVKRQADRLTEQYVERYRAFEDVPENKPTAV